MALKIPNGYKNNKIFSFMAFKDMPKLGFLM
jgi:hypothetical protein